MGLNWIRRRPAPPAPVDADREAPGDGLATEADILACFRLLLGREPGRDERVGHLAQVGRPLADVVGAYLGSSEFKRRRLASAATGEARLVSTKRGFSLFVDPEDTAVGGPIAWSGDYEPHVTAVFERHLRPGLRVLDIGANIGWFTMLAACRVGDGGHVLAVEPNPANARLLEASRQAAGFGQVTLLPVAAGRRHGALALHRSYSNGSVTALEEVEVLAAEIVPVVRLDDVVGDDPVGLIKIDVEGAEGAALDGLARTLRRNRPVILSEFSPGMMPGASGMEGADYVDWLLGLGYQAGVIGADGAVAPCPSGRAALDAHARSGVDHVDLLLTPE